MLFRWHVLALALAFSSILSITCVADPIKKINQRFISYGNVDRTEIAAVVSEISTVHDVNNLLVVVNEYEGSQLMRQSICPVIEDSYPHNYDLRMLYCQYLPSTSVVQGKFTLDALEGLKRDIYAIVREGDNPKRITFEYSISDYKSFTQFSLKFKRPNKSKRSGWTRVTRIRPQNMDCTAGVESIKCLWNPESEQHRLLENLEPQK